MTTNCFPCTLYQAGESTETVDGIRIQRLLLKVLTRGTDAESEMLAELGECPGCTVRIAGRLIYIYSHVLTNHYGSAEAAKQALDVNLAEALKNLPPDERV